MYLMLLNDLFAFAQTGEVLNAESPAVIGTIRGAQYVDRSCVAALALIVYDILITFDDEVAIVWPKPWSFMKFNYFVIRYVPLLVQMPTSFAHQFGCECYWHYDASPQRFLLSLVFKGATSILTIVSLDYILIARIFALYFDNCIVRSIAGVAYIIEIVLMAVGFGLATPGIRYNSSCVVIYMPNIMLFYSIASIGFQTLLFGLTLYRFVVSVRAGWGNIPVVRLLMRDGTWAFFLVFVLIAFTFIVCFSIPLRYAIAMVYLAEMLSQAALFGVRNPVYIGVLYGWLLSSFSFCGYRIFLNINRVPVSNDIAPRTHRSSSVQFTSIISDEVYDMDDINHISNLI